MHYYLISFFYPGPYCGAAGPGYDDSLALSSAENRIVSIIKEKSLDAHAAYAWPDGSLYYYLRSPKPLDQDEIKALFQDDEQIVMVGTATEQTDYQQIGPAALVTLEERFALPSEQLLQRGDARRKEREALYANYYQHRENCSLCKPQHLPCKRGNELFKSALDAENQWRKQPRPLTCV